MERIIDRLGVITDEVSSDIITALDFAAANGLKHIEIRSVDNRNVLVLSDEEADRIRTEAQSRGLFISCIASPVFKCALDASRQVAEGDRFNQAERSVTEHFAMLERALELGERLGTNRIRIFSFWREEEPIARFEAEIVSHLTRAAKLAEERGMLLLLENEPSCNGGFAVEIARLAAVVQSPALRILWDPGNEQYGSKPSYPEGYSAVREFIAHVHLKDVVLDAEGKPRAVPIGAGLVPYEAHFHALREDGYTGLFTIETHYIPEGGTALEGTAMSLTGLNTLLERLQSK
ncbi:sugar phosphate isomerase/epimerase [Paenibacillus sp. OV219]|uniref:sugar phosphate isomerase/epimerase family protein n=1 Tax=Paenibacillus sp. OV219 TaxID=1884377 RepID=UPI0008C8CE40|nr:sugar phosphate isomerase/epimerase family protein [Paenibacillus sp. OV219]SEN86922.1 Sugar phosphate isomerase/epimerase [Paenibacillus sp. OV219]